MAKYLENLSSEVIDALNAPIIEDRAKYSIVFDTATAYVRQHKLLIDDKYALVGRLNDISRLQNYKIVIYCNEAFKHANNLCNEVYLALKGAAATQLYSLKLMSKVRNEEFEILYGGRSVIKIFNILKEFAKTIRPYYVGEIPYLPPDIQLIEVFWNNYTCETPLSDFEQPLFDLLADHLKKGGNVAVESECASRKKETVELIKAAIVQDFLKDNVKFALCGIIAADIKKNGGNLSICMYRDRIQLLSAESDEYLLQALKNYFAEAKLPYELTMKSNIDLLIPKDSRTTRSIISIRYDVGRSYEEKPIIEYFSTAQFEIVPVEKVGNLYIASRNVLARFICIDLYINKFIYGLGKIDKETYEKKKYRYLSVLQTIQEFKNESTGIIGIYYELANYLKEEKDSKEKDRIPPYIPYLATTLREIK